MKKADSIVIRLTGMVFILIFLTIAILLILVILLLIGAALAHFLCLATLGRLPRWLGWPFIAAYAYFVGAGLLG